MINIRLKILKAGIGLIVYDGSINCYNANGDRASKSYSVEMNSPVLEYGDIPLLQEVVRALRKAGGVTGPRYCAGTHIHISADDYTPQADTQSCEHLRKQGELSVGRFAGIISP